MSETKELPCSWIEVRIQDIAQPGGTWNPKHSSATEFLYVDVDALDNSTQTITAPKLLPTSEAPSRARMAIKAGDIIFSLVRPYLKNIAIVPPDLDGQVASTAYCVMRPEAGLLSKYLFYAMLRDSFINSVATYGDSPPAGHDDEFLAMRIPVAPREEQRRIVAAIEQHFTRLDAAVAALKRVRAALKRYRAAVLKAAVAGKLTESWRGEHADVEPASALLARILAERRARWEADLRARGKDPAKAKYEEPKRPDTANLPELPEGWCWATVEQLAAVIGGVTKGRNLQGRSVVSLPYLRVANVQRGFVDLREVKYIEVPQDEVERYLLRAGDVVLTEGGDADKLGRAAFWQGQVDPCIHQNHIFRARLSEPDMPPQWLAFYANSEQGRTYFLGAAKQTVNLASINLTQLRNCPVPLPPLSEQTQIVAEVERRLSVVDELEATVEANLKRAERLRQSILERAFTGQLVPRDLHDEPASALLERIQRERARNGKRSLTRDRREEEAGPRQAVMWDTPHHFT